MILLIDTPCVW